MRRVAWRAACEVSRAAGEECSSSSSSLRIAEVASRRHAQARCAWPSSAAPTAAFLWQQQQPLHRAPFSSHAAPDASLQPIHKLVVANRGEIACRVLITARKLGVPTVALYSEADRHAKHVRLADEAHFIGGAAARDSYLRGQAILDVCRLAGGRSVHPGYGFLSENAAFADMCAEAGLAFVGPGGAAIRAMGNKSEAKRIMAAAGVPVVPGYHGSDQSHERLLHEAAAVGFPLLIKAVSGGGGKGMKLAHSLAEVPEALASAKREAAAAFGDDRVLLERYIQRPRHVEVQVVADSLGGAVYLYDRDCSVQRRHQKVIEEAPAPGLSDEFHRQIGEAAVRAARAVGYVNAGTVEFIVDTDAQGPSKDSADGFYFMEMNTRLQVEHPVSEEVSGVDLVEWQLRVAAGLALPLTQDQLGASRGHAFEARLYSENPRRDFLPGAGTVRRWRVPPGAGAFSPPHGGRSSGRARPTSAADEPRVRVDSGVEEGDVVGTFYDPMIAKVVAWGPDRAAALRTLSGALAQTQVSGLPVNLEFLKRLAAHPAFASASDLTTAFIKQHRDALMAPAALPPHAAALAAVARHLLEVARQQQQQHMGAAGAGGAGKPKGPWELADSKRLWGQHVVRAFPGMMYPEGEGGPDAVVSLTLKVLSEDHFEVAKAPGVSGEAGAGAEGGSGGQAGVQAVRDARLDPATGRLTAEVDGRRVAADVATYSIGGTGATGGGGQEVLTLWVDGAAHELRWALPEWSEDAGGAHHGHGGAGGKVLAPMPGRVVKLLAAEGAAVAAGAPLVVLEAMKMEHPVVAPRAGVVRGLAVSVGGQVSDGQVLMWVEEQEKEGEGEGEAAKAKGGKVKRAAR